jgi:hypothetical protein
VHDQLRVMETAMTKSILLAILALTLTLAACDKAKPGEGAGTVGHTPPKPESQDKRMHIQLAPLAHEESYFGER